MKTYGTPGLVWSTSDDGGGYGDDLEEDYDDDDDHDDDDDDSLFRSRAPGLRCRFTRSSGS